MKQENSAQYACRLSDTATFSLAKSSPIIELQQVSFTYRVPTQADVLAVADTTIQVKPGQHVVILGRNGSGKSTIAKLINALLLPDKGAVLVAGYNSTDPHQVIDIRRHCGMVFQNPDNQIVGTTVEEDVAFGPENLGIPHQQLQSIVDQALEDVGLSGCQQKSPTQLSGGQKQKLAIAGILAMKPQCMILDESTSMLDPVSAADFIELVTQLRKEHGITVVEITHDMQAAMQADYIYVMSEGRVVGDGTPRSIFTRPDLLLSAGLEIPAHLSVLYTLSPEIFADPADNLTVDVPTDGVISSSKPFSYQEVTAALQNLVGTASMETLDQEGLNCGTASNNEASGEDVSREHVFSSPEKAPPDTILEIKNLNYSYNPGTPTEFKALSNINLTIKKGEFVAIVGHSGSGKSTLITHFNGLLIPQSGSVEVKGIPVKEKKDIRQIRKFVGLLFQYPEYQLFEESVYLDIAFGPRQLGWSEQEVDLAVREAAADTGLNEELLNRSPFDLSGGQKRRVAIAGVLAMKPELLVLDEPAAGLDPVGRREILGYLQTLKNRGKTIILVTHNMEDAAELADRIVVLEHGKIVADNLPENIFSDSILLEKANLTVPAATEYANYLVAAGLLPNTVFRQSDLIHAVRKFIVEGENE